MTENPPPPLNQLVKKAILRPGPMVASGAVKTNQKVRRGGMFFFFVCFLKSRSEFYLQYRVNARKEWEADFP